MSDKSSESPPGDGGVIDGGEINNIAEKDIKVDPLLKQRVETAKNLGYLLIIILAVSVAAHYATMTWLLVTGRTAVADTVERIFSTWLPVISGLAGSAVTYFFTK